LIFKPHGFAHAKWFNREPGETHENSWQLFLDKPFCPAQGQNLKRDGRQNKPSIVSWVAFECDDLIAGLSEELCESSTLTRKEP
jgi:hypothetical protein